MSEHNLSEPTRHALLAPALSPLTLELADSSKAPVPSLTSLLHRSLLKTYLKTLLLFLLLDSVLSITTKKSTNRRRKGDLTGRGGGASKLSRFLTAIKLTYVIMFLPILLIFFWSVFRDPASPQILKACWGILKKKAVGYLGRPEEVDLENKRS